MSHIAIIILAAGASKRMGTIKQVLPWGNRTLLDHAISTAKQSKADKIRTVLGANSSIIQEKIRDGSSDFVVNESWSQGMGSSISCGVTSLLKAKSKPEGILIMLCDQPLIDTPYLDRMIDSLIDSDKGIVATAYGDKIGVPAIFGSTYFKQLVKLEDDKGARDLLIEYRTDCIILDLDEHQTLDVDSDEDYQQLLKFLE